MNSENYKKSDLLIISDFMMASLPDSLNQAIIECKKNKNKFYSLSIGDLFLDKRLKKLFDNEWVYDPNSLCIHSLQGMVSSI